MGEPANMRRRDYPILFWLSQCLDQTTKVLNLGGNVGAEYFTYRQFMHLPDHLTWLVWELPYAVNFGNKLVSNEVNAPGLNFTTDLKNGDGADVLLTCGALQYFEDELADIVGRFKTRPRHLFISRVPLVEGPTFYTLQSVVNSVVPYRIQSRTELIQSLNGLGYRLIDSWYEEHEILIPFHADHSVEGFFGFYFKMGGKEPDWRAEAIDVGRHVQSKVASSFLFGPMEKSTKSHSE